MSRRLVLSTLAIAALVLGAMAAANVGSSSGDHHNGPQKIGKSYRMEKPRTPSEVRRMIDELDHRKIETSIRTLAGFGTRNTLSSQTDPVRGIGAARDWIQAQFQQYALESDGRLEVTLQSYTQTSGLPAPTVITNVVATLHGTDPASTGRHYVISGHYDSRCSNTNDAVCDAPGANDDASGVAAVLELARVMSKREFESTIVFMAVAGEEQGLFGSTRYATLAQSGGLNIEGMFTNDIIGSSLGGNGDRERHAVRVFAEGVPTNETNAEANTRRSIGGENDSPARQMARFVEEYGENEYTDMDVWVIYRRDRFGRGGDHIPFLERGFRAAVRFTEPNENFNHQHQDVRIDPVTGEQIGDLSEFVDFRYIERVARVDLAALAALANAPVAPKNVRITNNLSYDTDLRWNANLEPDLAGYEIVWRDTTDADWTHVIPVGSPTPDATGVVRWTVEGMSKDNFFFGVRAVDTDGNRSAVVFPRP
jgi:hypothetical protein